VIILSSFRARQSQYERDLATEALSATKGAILAAARLCGLHPYQMRRIVKRHSLQSMLVNQSSGAGCAKSGNSAWRELG
jgi:transcriptional regulator with GAF, ATPase, and Fis domain